MTTFMFARIFPENQFLGCFYLLKSRAGRVKSCADRCKRRKCYSNFQRSKTVLSFILRKSFAEIVGVSIRTGEHP